MVSLFLKQPQTRQTASQATRSGSEQSKFDSDELPKTVNKQLHSTQGKYDRKINENVVLFHAQKLRKITQLIHPNFSRTLWSQIQRIHQVASQKR